MADDETPSSSICTIKMDINCCQKCPLKLERKLLKSTGVESVAINPHKGLVTVIGDIDPIVLLQKLQAMGKETKLWFFQKEPDRDDCSKSASKIEHDSIESDSYDEDDNKQFGWHSQHKCVTETMEMKEATSSDVHSCSYSQSLPPMSSNVHAYPYSRSLLPAKSSNVHAYSYSRSLPRFGYQTGWPYQQSVPGHTFTPHSYHLQPHPQPPTYHYFQNRSPPRDNPMVHYTDYRDNYRF
ncbi:uncharacterized protein LOC103492695 [Cucumis melo]|uniref:Uncharacterized protein LOC103492695 n=2 Tax=Cucumis melo TaxID=3656 RepID=A0A1S4DZF3_CUCME|nr:uncharacterized protein LOC103492695 [Cucumis melo]